MIIIWNIIWIAIKDFFGGWFAARREQKDIKDAIAPYKAEAEALAQPPHTKHDDIEWLRGRQD